MKLRELIAELEDLVAVHGDMDIWIDGLTDWEEPDIQYDCLREFFVIR